MTCGSTRTPVTGHVGLNVSDLDRSKQFYREVFGFQVAGESQDPHRRFVFLSDGSTLVLTLWQQGKGRVGKNNTGLHHHSFQVAAIADVKAVEQRLREMNVPFIYDGIVPHAEGAQSGGIFFEDPDGIRLEIYAPNGAGNHGTPSPGSPPCGFF